MGIAGDVELFPEWDEYLRLEMKGGAKEEKLVDVGGDGGEDAGDEDLVEVDP